MSVDTVRKFMFLDLLNRLTLLYLNEILQIETLARKLIVSFIAANNHIFYGSKILMEMLVSVTLVNSPACMACFVCMLVT